MTSVLPADLLDLEPSRPDPELDVLRFALAEIDRLGGDAAAPGAPRSWAPQPGPQSEFFHSTAYEVLYGGAAGGGKSSCAVALPLPWIHHPQLRVLMLRRTTPQLEDLLDKARGIYRDGVEGEYTGACPTAEFRGDKNLWTFPSGAKVRFNHCQYVEDAFNYQGHEYQIVVFDELTHFEEAQYQEIATRIRAGVAGLPRYLRATTNPGGTGHCVPFGEVLTPSGWRDIRDFKAGDPVFSVRPDGSLFETTVAQVHQHDHDGDLIDVDANGFRMVCTPEHRVAKVGGRRHGLNTRGGARDRFALVPFEELPGQATILRSVAWSAASLPDFEVPPVSSPKRGRLKNHQPTKIQGRLFCSLLGWFLSEGHTTSVEGKPQWFAIAQEKPEGRERIRALLTACGFAFSETPSQFIVYSSRWTAYLAQFGKSRDKFIPAWVKAGSVEDLRALFDALMSGDGHWSRPGKTGTYYTISRRLADDVSEVALKLGYCVTVRSRQREGRDGLSYEVHVSTKKSGGTEILTGQHVYNVVTSTARRSNIQRTPFRGKVYCLGIKDTHTFLLRQHGSVWVSGNSWVFKHWRWWLDPKAEIPGREPRFDDSGKRLPPAAPGEVLWILRRPGATEEEVVEDHRDGACFMCGQKEACTGDLHERVTATSRTFIPARATDNPALMRRDPDYTARLRNNDPVRAAQLIHGDWLVQSGAGLYFRREWVTFVDADAVPKSAKRCRGWDRAATEPSEKNRDPDWTRGIRLAYADGRWYIEDRVGLRAGPGPVKNLIRNTAETDGKSVRIRLPQDPGQAGKSQASDDVAALAGFTVTIKPVSGDKETRFGPVSAQAHPQSTGGEKGRFCIVRAPWNEDLLRELEAFPDGAHDDDADALADAFDELAPFARRPASAGKPPPLDIHDPDARPVFG